MTREAELALAPVVLPLFGAALALLGKAFARPGSREARLLEGLGAFVGLVLPWGALLALAPLALGGGSVGGIVGGWPAAAGIAFRFDGLAWLVSLLGFAVAGPAWLYAAGAGPRGPAFTALYLVQASALAATCLTADFFNLFVCLEVLGMASYVLVTCSEKPGAYLASFSYLMVSASAMVFFLFGVYGLYRLTGRLEYEAVARALAALPEGGGAAAAASLASIAAAVALRTAVMPLYGWLPDAHALAPHAVSAVLSGVLIKTPLFALTRILVLLPGGGETGALFGSAGAATALVGVLIALSQRDAKRLLAYHSVSQIGYVVAAWGGGIALAAAGDRGGAALLLSAAFLHAFFHALFKGLLFLAVGRITDAAGERDVYRLRAAAGPLRAAGERFPLTLLAFAAGALSISAIPPFNGYASKLVLSKVLAGRWEYALLLAASVGTIASFLKLSMIFAPARKEGGGGGPSPGVEAATIAAAGTGSGGGSGTPSAALAAPAVLAAEAFLALACLASGLAAPALFHLVLSSLGAEPALAAGSAAAWAKALYAPKELLKTLLLVAGGLALFVGARSAPGKRITALIRGRPRGFHGLFLALCLGTAVLTAWLLP